MADEQQEAFVDEYLWWAETDSAREDWFRGWCEYDGCKWETTGAEGVVEESAYEHASEHLSKGRIIK